MLAYTFWHWPKASITADEYENRVHDFHQALAGSPSIGFSHSYCLALRGEPWANDGSAAFEDWYIVNDSAALDPLNNAAVTASRQVPHDSAAGAAAGGTGGLYRLRLGTVKETPLFEYWFAKPPGMQYGELYATLGAAVRECDGALWGRQMTLGPASEFCLQSHQQCAGPIPFTPLELRLRPVWP